MKFVYRRVSTTDQKTDRQLPGWKADREYEDKLSGKDLNRPQLTAMLQTLREGDVVHVHELSRLGRSVRDLLDVVQQIVDAGETIHFHKENLRFEPSKEDPFQKLMLTLLSSVAEFERSCIKQRQREGIAIAKAQGRYKGRQSRFSEGQLDQIRKEFDEEQNKTALAKRWGVSRGYLYKIAAKGEASPA